MTAHGILLSIAFALAVLYIGLWVGERTNDRWIGWAMGALVLAAGLTWDAGI